MPLLGKSQAQPHQQQQLPGVHFPDSTLTPDGHYFALPPAEQTVIGEARALFEKQQDDGPDSGWTDLGTKQGIRLSKKFEASQPNDVPWVRGVGTLPFPPQAATAIITHPAFRMFWDERLAAGHTLQRYAWDCNKWYSVTKQPAPLVQPRDMVGMHHTCVLDSCPQEAQQKNEGPRGATYIVLQRSCEGDEFISRQTSEQLKRTRASLDLCAWSFAPTPTPHETKVTYMMRIKMNGSLPSWLVGQLSTEIPLGVAKVRTCMSKVGFPPYFPLDDVLSHHATRPEPQRPLLPEGVPPESHCRVHKTGYYVLDLLRFDLPARYCARIVVHTLPVETALSYDPQTMYPQAPVVMLSGPAAQLTRHVVDHDRARVKLFIGDSAAKPADVGGLPLDVVMDRAT